MKKKYSLNYNIERDVDRVAAIVDILDKLEKDPSPADLEQMASYILYGKDEDGYNAVQRGELTNGNTRYNSFKTKDDKLLSLDAIMESPTADQTSMQSAHVRSHYTQKKPTIAKPKYDKKTGELLDIGDADIPGMTELWDSIARYEHKIAVAEGKVPPNEGDYIYDDPYKIYQLKHTLIDLRRHQYYLKDGYKPEIHFLKVDRPQPQFMDWTCDSFYWMSLEQWHKRVDNALLHSISKNLADYETRQNPETGETEVKWVVREHTFDWENPVHIRALLNNYDAIYNQFYDKLNTYSRTLIFDFERYRKMANFSEVREFLIDRKIERYTYAQIQDLLLAEYGLKYNENHLCIIYAKEIPERMAATAKKWRLINTTPPDELKKCFTCGRVLPRDTLFFSRNRSRKDGFSSNCKECEKKRRIVKGGQPLYDRRSKEATLY